VKQLHGNSLLFGTAAFIFLAAQPVWADTTQITDVQLSPVNGGINVILKTSSGSRPQVFTTKRDKALVTDIINTQLRLPQGKNFRQDNPAAGIASVEIVQLDANSIRVVVTGSNNAPTSKPVARKENGITLGFTSSEILQHQDPQQRHQQHQHQQHQQRHLLLLHPKQVKNQMFSSPTRKSRLTGNLHNLLARVNFPTKVHLSYLELSPHQLGILPSLIPMLLL